ncbi:MAG: aminotransferase class I/II-fold pyridoxal phosphate-dependent enzyme, partial [Candidatus Methylomirabilis sp.]|nr:aminotransferase class I/II-fold pyridoxal phosphate-dependent enzyme [Deltaproteobacteria bacterium]
LVAAMDDIQSQMTSNACSISQAAAVAAIGGPQDCIAPMVAEFKKRRDYIVGRLNRMPGVRCNLPAGAFYVFPDVSGVFGRKANGKAIDSGEALTEHLLESAGVAVVPGEGFGDKRFVRLSYATSMDAIARGMDLMEKALADLE